MNSEKRQPHDWLIRRLMVPAIALVVAGCAGGSSTDSLAVESVEVESSVATPSPTEQQEPETLNAEPEPATPASEATASESTEPESTEPGSAESAPGETESNESPGSEDEAGPDADAVGTEPAGRAPIQSLSPDVAIANAEANIDTLQSADSVLDIEVLAVADGSVQTVRDVVTGDRPVLLWFFSPH